jgi:hypothetical protein
MEWVIPVLFDYEENRGSVNTIFWMLRMLFLL